LEAGFPRTITDAKAIHLRSRAELKRIRHEARGLWSSRSIRMLLLLLLLLLSTGISLSGA